MNTSNYLLILLFSILPTLLLAQPTYEIKLNPKEKDFFGQQFYIAAVLDKRPKKEFIGMVEKDGMMKALQFKEVLEDHLQAAFLKMYPCQRDLAPIIAEVHELRVVESPFIDNQQEGTVTIEFVFLLPDSTTLTTFKKTKTYSSGDVTKKHKEEIEALLDLSLLRVHEVLQQKIAKGEIAAPTASPLSFPLPKGIYPTFLDMVKGIPTPIPCTPIRRTGKLERYDFKYLDRDRKKIKQAFCVSDGKQLYLNARVITTQKAKENPLVYTLGEQQWVKGHFLKPQFTGRYIYVEDRFTKGYLGIAFGLAGSAAGLKKLGVVLDTNDGSFHILNRDYLKLLLDNYPDQKAAYNATKKDYKAKKEALQKFNVFLDNS